MDNFKDMELLNLMMGEFNLARGEMAQWVASVKRNTPLGAVRNLDVFDSEKKPYYACMNYVTPLMYTKKNMMVSIDVVKSMGKENYILPTGQYMWVNLWKER